MKLNSSDVPSNLLPFLPTPISASVLEERISRWYIPRKHKNHVKKAFINGSIIPYPSLRTTFTFEPEQLFPPMSTKEISLTGMILEALSLRLVAIIALFHSSYESPFECYSRTSTSASEGQRESERITCLFQLCLPCNRITSL